MVRLNRDLTGEGKSSFQRIEMNGQRNFAKKMLTTSLRNMERVGFVLRTVTPSSPPRVDYELTILVPVAGLAEWSIANTHRMDAVRHIYDRKHRM